jgi:hypothetical protein
MIPKELIRENRALACCCDAEERGLAAEDLLALKIEFAQRHLAVDFHGDII